MDIECRVCCYVLCFVDIIIYEKCIFEDENEHINYFLYNIKRWDTKKLDKSLLSLLSNIKIKYIALHKKTNVYYIIFISRRKICIVNYLVVLI